MTTEVKATGASEPSEKSPPSQDPGSVKNASDMISDGGQEISSDGLEGKSKGPDTPALVATTTAIDRPYSSFTSKQKFVIVFVATIGGSFSPFTTNIYFPAIDILSKSLDVSISQINLTVTSYMIFQGLSPSFTSAIADDYGRRPGYVIGFLIYLAANLGLALNNSYAGLLVLRCLQSAGSSGLVTLSYGTIADIVTSAERGRYIAITSLAVILAPSLAPIVGGLLAENLGWHAIFWFLVIFGAVYFIPLLLFFPETGRTVVGDGSLTPPKWNRCLTDIKRLKKQASAENQAENGSASANDGHQPEQETSLKSQRRKWDIFGPLFICLDPETAILLFYIGIIYSGFYIVSVSLTVQFHDIYGINSTVQGLLFIPQGIGAIMAAITNSFLLDWNYKRQALKAGLEVDRKKQGDLLKMPLERARMQAAIPFFLSGAIFIIVFGWLLEAKVSIWGPLVILVFIGYTVLAGFNPMSVLIIDLHRSRAASASAANNLVRCLLGAGATAIANPLIDALGVGWAFTFVGLVELACLPMLLIPLKYGMKWRAEKREKEDVKKRELEEKERQHRGKTNV